MLHLMTDCLGGVQLWCNCNRQMCQDPYYPNLYHCDLVSLLSLDIKPGHLVQVYVLVFTAAINTLFHLKQTTLCDVPVCPVKLLWPNSRLQVTHSFLICVIPLILMNGALKYLPTMTCDVRNVTPCSHGGQPQYPTALISYFVKVYWQ